jgi:Amidohydrolase family
VSGSDGGIAAAKPHGLLPVSVAFLVDGGVSTAATLASATALPAAACGLRDKKGRLRAGYDADPLVVDGDPVADTGALARPVAVFAGGRRPAGASRAGSAGRSPLIRLRGKAAAVLIPLSPLAVPLVLLAPQFVQGHPPGGIWLRVPAEEFGERDCLPPSQRADSVGDNIKLAPGHLVQGAHPPLRLPFGHARCARTRKRFLDVNAYVREDQILPHLAALAILLAASAGTPARGSRSRAKLTGPANTAALIDQLRADGTVLTYGPDGRTLRAGGHGGPSVTIGMHAAGTHSRQDRERRIA